MATRILFDPRVDLPDGTSTSSPVIIEATPTAIRASGAVVTFPTTLGFTVNSAADVVQLATPGAGQAWRLVVRRPGGTRIGSLYASPGAILLDRTVTWTDAPTIAWQALTDVDPATLIPTADVAASWAATAALAQSALDAVNALKAGAPGALDTFLELATQLSTDETGTAALATLVAGKADATSVAATQAALAAQLTGTAAGLAIVFGS